MIGGGWDEGGGQWWWDGNMEEVENDDVDIT